MSYTIAATSLGEVLCLVCYRSLLTCVRLAKYLRDKKSGGSESLQDGEDLQLMQDLVAEFSKFAPKMKSDTKAGTSPTIVSASVKLNHTC